ncbi:MAG TPA: hypothetical protein VJV04_15975 [Nitrospiraceae bacterium]|nr:hypothetical protein [Nitrospiraceae bacterium]
MTYPFTILNVSGPYREPRELVLSYDYSVQRPNWPTPNGVRVKVSIPDELDYLKTKILTLSGGTPGQQMIITQMLSRRIADHKLHMANEAQMFLDRGDVMVGPFTGPLVHLFAQLEAWMQENKVALRQEITAHLRL